jgi:hypothetical protein
MPFPASVVMTVTLVAAAATVAGNTAAAAVNWTLASGSSYIGTGQTSADTVVIDWEFTTIGVGLWVTADGAQTAAIGGTNCIYLPPTSEGTATSSGQGILENIQAIPNWNIINGVATYRNGVTGAFDQSEAVNFTAQSGMTGLHLWNTAPNWLSFIADATPVTGHVTVTFQ